MTRTIALAGNPIEVEVAENDAHRYKGLSDRDELGKDEGMMFVWPMEKEHGLVMRDMNFGIDMVFADAEGEVTKVHSANPDEEGTTAFSKYAVELPKGYCEAAGVEKGDRLELDAGGLGKSDRDTMNKTDLFKELEGVSFYSEINDTEVKVVDVEGDKVRVTDEDNEWWERMEDVRDKITDGAWEEKDDPCWDGYEMQGTKEQDGETVPNCVPKSVDTNEVTGDIAEKLSEVVFDGDD